MKWYGLATLVGLLIVSIPAWAQNNTDRLGDALPANAVQRLGTMRMKYTSGVSDIAYLPDGRGIVATGTSIHIWDLAKGEIEVEYKVSNAGLGCMMVSKDGKRILFASGGDVLEWSLEEQKELHRFPTNQQSFKWVYYSPDEKRVLTTGTVPPTLKEFDLATGEELIAIDGSDDVATYYKGIYGPEGKTAFVGAGYDDTVCHYDLSTGEKLRMFLKNYCAYDMCLSPDRKRLLVGSRSYGSEWDLDEYKMLAQFKGHHGGAVNSVAYCQEPEQVLTGSRDGSIRRWDRTKPEILLRWFPHERYANILRVSPDGKYVLSYGGGLVAESELATGKPRVEFERHAGSVEGVGFLPDGKQVVSGSSDGTLRLWDVTSGETKLVMEGANLGAYSLAVSPDGTRAAAGCKDGVLREFSVADGKLLRELKGHLGYVRSVKYTHDGKMLLSSAGDGSVRIWTPESEEAVGVLQGHLGGVLAVDVSADDNLILSGGRDGTVRLWDLETQEELKKMEGHRGWVNAVAFSADGEEALSGGRDQKIFRWNLASAEKIAEMEQATWVKAMVVSPDGTKLYATGDDPTIKCWDLTTGENVQELKGQSSRINGLAVSPDGKLLTSASADTTLLVWSIE